MTDKAPNERGWRRAVLPVSLLLNLFLIAVIGGQLLRRHFDEAGLASAPFARALANAQANLSRSDAAVFTAVIRRDAPRYAEAAREAGAARRTLEQQLLAQPIDQKAARQALLAWQASWNHFLDDFGGTLIDALAQISPQGRQKLVAARLARASLRPAAP